MEFVDLMKTGLTVALRLCGHKEPVAAFATERGSSRCESAMLEDSLGLRTREPGSTCPKSTRSNSQRREVA